MPLRRTDPSSADNFPATSETFALRLNKVGCAFGALAILSDISLTVRAGERIAILGANGAGKTTLLNVINGDLTPTGEIFFFGENITAYPPHRRARIGLRRTYQISLLFGGLSVFDNLYLACRGVAAGRYSMRRPGRKDAATEEARRVLRAVRLDVDGGKIVRELSHGQQRQLEIGMALVHAPRFILFDEPAAGLSPAERSMLVEILSGLPRDVGYILIEHDLDIALRVVDKVLVLHNGCIFREGTPEEIEQDRDVQAIYLGNIHESTKESAKVGG